MKTTAGKPPKIAQPHGGSLNAGGTPGNRGGAGRPPNWLKEWCEDQLASPAVRKAVERVLRDHRHPGFVAMWKAVADRAAGKPQVSVEVSNDPQRKGHAFIVNGQRIEF